MDGGGDEDGAAGAAGAAGAGAGGGWGKGKKRRLDQQQLRPSGPAGALAVLLPPPGLEPIESRRRYIYALRACRGIPTPVMDLMDLDDGAADAAAAAAAPAGGEAIVDVPPPGGKAPGHSAVPSFPLSSTHHVSPAISELFASGRRFRVSRAFSRCYTAESARAFLESVGKGDLSPALLPTTLAATAAAFTALLAAETGSGGGSSSSAAGSSSSSLAPFATGAAAGAGTGSAASVAAAAVAAAAAAGGSATPGTAVAG